MEKKYFTYFSPAKVNLFFKVLFKRKDGYHEIASLYQAISLGDTLHISLSNEDAFKCDGFSFSDNLITKAIDLFKKKTKISFQTDIILEKNIPLEAGLGGGSSNAATILYGLNELLGRPAALKDLIEWSKLLGSDVAFFLSHGTAFCSGRGEIFQEIEPKKFSAYIAKPSFGSSTAFVYKNVKVESLDKSNNIEKALQAYQNGEFAFFNDLEKAAFFINPRLQTIKESLYSMGFSKVVMTGSGSAFYCLYEKEPDIEKSKDLKFYKVEGVWRNSDKWYSALKG